MRIKLCIALIPLLIPAMLFGQGDGDVGMEEEPAYNLVTDRPDQTLSALTVPPVRLQVEAGYENIKKGGVGFTSIPTILLRAGLLSRVELRVGGGYVRNKFPTGTLDGLGNVTIGTKVQVLGSYEEGLKAALIVDVAPPIGSEGVSPEGMGGAVTLSLADQFAGLDLTGNLGVEVAEGQRPVGTYSISYNRGIAGNVGGFLELFGRVSHGAFPEHSLNAGTAILLMRNLQVDLANAFSLSDAAPDSFFTVGISWRFPH